MDIRHLTETAFRYPLDTPTPYAQNSAAILAADRNGHWCQITEYPDVYMALDTISDKTATLDCVLPGQPLRHTIALAILTTGWASPIDESLDDIPPSQHPNRRRVRIALVITTDLKTGSILGFEDDPNNPIFDEGQATGELTTSAVETMRAILTYQQASNNIGQ